MILEKLLKRFGRQSPAALLVKPDRRRVVIRRLVRASDIRRREPTKRPHGWSHGPLAPSGQQRTGHNDGHKPPSVGAFLRRSLFVHHSILANVDLVSGARLSREVGFGERTANEFGRAG